MIGANLAVVPLLLVGCAGCGCVVVSAAQGSLENAPTAGGIFGGGSGGGGGGGRNGDGGVDDNDDDNGDNDKTLTVSSAVKGCLAGVDPFLPCINERAMTALERTESADALYLDPGLEIARRPGDDAFAPRGIYSFGGNPYNVGAVIEAASSLLSRRTFIWDLSALFPGLQMRIGPTYNGRGLIDFNVDRRYTLDEKSLSYGHMIFKRSFLPNVLATQISIASVIPLLFAAIYFITKKAVLLSKIAIIVTSVVGYGSVFLNYHGTKPVNSHQSFGVQHPPSAAGYYPISGYYPTSGHHHNAFVGDIRGDQFYKNFDGYQQISSFKPAPSLFRGVNYFPGEELADRSKKESG